MDGILGLIKLYISDQAPDDWAVCDGKMLQISEFQELFNQIGTHWGGDGKTDFGLPNLGKHEAGWFLMKVKSSEADANFAGMLSQIALYAGSDTPDGWVACDGRILQSADYSALSKVMGNRYGGDGEATFALPGIPDVQGVRYLICLDGVNPMGPGSDDEDDDDY